MSPTKEEVHNAEEAAEAKIAKFEIAFLKFNSSPLTKVERAILKTYLVYEAVGLLS